ncbi:hypothetical protein MMC09_002934 [Bachmanniomyces sp. S44760]|nr:hypothetical protein [Bachmanniomyces sp. S44760]
MTLKELLKGRVKTRDVEEPANSDTNSPVQPEFSFVRSDTNTQEIISPPSFTGDGAASPSPTITSGTNRNDSLKRLSRLRASSNASTHSEKSEKKHLSQRLHLRSPSHGSSVSSINVPEDLPNIDDASYTGDDKEAQWEKRATILAERSPLATHVPPSPGPPTAKADRSEQDSLGLSRPQATRSISDAQGDENIQEAIRLHEAGDLTNSTAMFGRLADPNGANNALSQVLYGLALRHGWGIAPDASLAINYLSSAASNSASIESGALSAGIKKGGAAKGELILAIYELANCFRHGWGIAKDPVAARKYYETAANLGDTDAMNEAAWCYEQGFGGAKKDRFKAAQYYRLAESHGNKTLGNTWIWKEKYDPILPSA